MTLASQAGLQQPHEVVAPGGKSLDDARGAEEGGGETDGPGGKREIVRPPLRSG
jgi:hypothetical protein